MVHAISKEELMKQSGLSGSVNEEYMYVDVTNLREFEGHTFKLDKDTPEFMELVESVKVLKDDKLEPATIRLNPKGSAEYEIIAGHRKWLAHIEAGKEKIYCRKVDMSDAEAKLWMVNSNNKRENISIRERAYSLKAKLDAMKELGVTGRVDKAVAESEEISRATVARMVRLTNLYDPVFDLLENGSVSMEAGEMISHLKKKNQKTLYDFLTKDEKPLKVNKAISDEIRTAENAKGDFLDLLEEIFDDSSKKKNVPKVSFTKNEIKEMFPNNYEGNEQDMKDLIESLVVEYFISEEKRNYECV